MESPNLTFTPIKSPQFFKVILSCIGHVCQNKDYLSSLGGHHFPCFPAGLVECLITGSQPTSHPTCWFPLSVFSSPDQSCSPIKSIFPECAYSTCFGYLRLNKHPKTWWLHTTTYYFSLSYGLTERLFCFMRWQVEH